MTKRHYEPELRDQIHNLMKVAEAHEEAQRERTAAIRKARRDLARMQRDVSLPAPDTAD